MQRALVQFSATVVLLGLAFVAYIFSQGVGIIVGMLTIPFFFLAWIDLGRALRRDGRTITFLLGVIVGMPQVLVGLGSIACGLLFVTTYLWPGSTAPTTWWMAALSPILIFFGIVWIRDALRKGQRDRNAASA